LNQCCQRQVVAFHVVDDCFTPLVPRSHYGK
jgi:hypothetical protein